MHAPRIFLAAILGWSLAAPAQAFFGFFSPYTDVQAQDGAVTIPTADVSDGQAHYYSFRTDDAMIKFFLIKSADGVIRAAFDACDVCFREKKGYSQDKDFMVCNNCGMRFHAARINEVSGGCNPSPLTRDLDGDTVRIAVADLRAGREYFQ